MSEANPEHNRLLKSLGLNTNTVYAKRWLRVNHKIVVHDDETEALAAADSGTIDGQFDETRFTLGDESGFYSNSMYVSTLGKDTFSIVSHTSVDGCNELNFTCTVDASGKVLRGKVNTFAFGLMNMDQGYMDELLAEWREQQYKWDIVDVRGSDTAPIETQ